MNDVVVNGAGPVGLTFAMAVLDGAALKNVAKPNVQIWDPHITPWRETVIRLPYSIAASLPNQVQMELFGETPSSYQRLFVPVPCKMSRAVENSRVHTPLDALPSQYAANVQTKQFQEAAMRYLMTHHTQNCSLRHGKCPPEILRQAAVVIQSFGKSARKTNPIAGNAVSEEKPFTMPACHPHGLFVLFDRGDVADGSQDPDYLLFNEKDNGFSAFQSHCLTNPVQVYIWPEGVTNDTGCCAAPTSLDDLIANGRSFGLRSLFDCVSYLQGNEDWWWEVSRRCRLQETSSNDPVPKERACTLEWQMDCPGWRQQYPSQGEKACSQAFESWFDAVRFQISLNLYKMGIVGTHAENFLHKVRLCYAQREPYRYDSVCTEVEGIPVIYLGDSAGSTDFKKGLSCGRGLFCAADLAAETINHFAHQSQCTLGQASWKAAFQYGAQKYQQLWRSIEMVSEWRDDFDASFKYLQAGRWPGQNVPLHANPGFPSAFFGA
jgi:hypothetical protein